MLNLTFQKTALQTSSEKTAVIASWKNTHLLN